MAYDKIFRKKVVEIKEKEGLSVQEVGQRFGISSRSVFRWKYKAEPCQTRSKRATKIDMEALKKDVEMYPDGYLKERSKRLHVSESCVFYALRRLKITCKKKRLFTQKGTKTSEKNI